MSLYCYIAISQPNSSNEVNILRFSSIIFSLTLAGVLIPKICQASSLIGRASVIDGDTIEVRGHKIRLNGIDAFESRQLCKDRAKKKYMCGNKSANHLDQLISGRTVNCKPEGNDRYGRILAECFAGRTNLNKSMVLSGWALAYRKYSRKYTYDEDIARKSKSGAWIGEFTDPWDYRAEGRTRTTRQTKELRQQQQQFNTSGSQVFRTCKEARKMGISQIRRGDPRYDPSMDKDKDGIACE